MQEILITSWDDFVNRTVELDGWAFRGQRDASWQLFSSLSRYLKSFVPDRNFWEEREARSIRIFRRKAHNYLPDASVLDDDMRCLALMQHHGAPTRLLDFTKSPFVAAFFAMESAITDVAVYALDTPALWNAAPTVSPQLTRKAIDMRCVGNFEKYFLHGHYPIVWTGEPKQMDRRLVAQSGTFVMPGALDEPIDSLLRHYPAGEQLIRKFILPIGLRHEAMQSLYRMNITNATLFPELEGLAKSLAYELEIIWQGLVDDPFKSEMR